MNEIIFTIEEDPDGGLTACSLCGCICTQGETLDELKDNIRDAVRCHFDDLENCPKIIRLRSQSDEVITL